MNDAEREVATVVINRAVAAGYLVSVYADGETPAEIHLSADPERIVAALGASGMDFVMLFDPVAHRTAGSITLVFGNADDGSELVADHTDTEEMRGIVGL